MTFNLNIDKLFANLRKLVPIILAIGIVAGLILFLPSSVVQKLHLGDIPENWLAIIGIIFLLSVFLIIIIVSHCIIAIASKKAKIILKIFQMKRSFASLDPMQKSIIRKLLQSGEKYIVLEIADGNADYLIAKGFIYRPDQPAILGWKDGEGDVLCAKYLAQPWLLTAYNKSPDYFLKG